MSETYCRDCTETHIHGIGDAEFCSRHKGLLALLDEIALNMEELLTTQSLPGFEEQELVDRYKALKKGD